MKIIREGHFTEEVDSQGQVYSIRTFSVGECHCGRQIVLSGGAPCPNGLESIQQFQLVQSLG